MFPKLVSRVRGAGTFIAFDLPTVQKRDALLTTMRRKGPLNLISLLKW